MPRVYHHTELLAHRDPETGKTQTVRDHTRGTGELGGSFLEKDGLYYMGKCGGEIHDVGKNRIRFTHYVQPGKSGEKKKTVNHTFAAVLHILTRNHKRDGPVEELGIRDLASEVLAFAAGSHHGLFDCTSPSGKSGFVHRMNEPDLEYDEILRNLGEEELDRWDCMFGMAVKELEAKVNDIHALVSERGPDISEDFYVSEVAFYISMLARQILSAITDGDRKNTAQSAGRAAYPRVRSIEENKAYWAKKSKVIDAYVSQLPDKTRIDKARRAISAACRAAAEMDPGLFILNVNTGGGKTLSGLRFAAAHAAKWGMDRVVFTAPRLAIIDQNAKAIRDCVKDPAAILEHHSNVTNLQGRSWKEHVAFSEGWDAPIIITTAVQLFDVMFSGKPEAVRKFHSLSGSVILIDEVQAIPNNQTTLFSMGMNFLTRLCRATVVLCTATQPELQCIKHSLIHHGSDPIREIPVPCDEYADVFRRCRVSYKPGTYSLSDIAKMTVELASRTSSTMVVCNTRKQARTLYKLLKGDGVVAFKVPPRMWHLSSSVCQGHREKILAELVEALNASREPGGTPVVCISTQVMEAGLDLSFASGIRFMAGLDSIIQCIGRINRAWELGLGVLGELYIVSCKDENLSNLPDIRDGQAATRALLAEYAADPAKFDGRLDSNAAISYYYKMLYRENSYQHDYVLPDGNTLYDLMSLNVNGSLRMSSGFPQCMRQALKTAGDAYTMFGKSTKDVIVPWGDGKRIIAELNGDRARTDLKYARRLLREARPYVISLFEHEVDELGRRGVLSELPGGALGLMEEKYYDEEIGFSLDGMGSDNPFGVMFG